MKRLNIAESDDIRKIIAETVKYYASAHPRPTQVSQRQAAEMLGISHPTLTKRIAAGQIKLNKNGLISITEVDRMLEPMDI